LVREHLSRIHINPAPCYLKISQSDVRDMMTFVQGQIERLVTTAFGGAAQNGHIRFAAKVLSNTLDQDLTPLRTTLRMSTEEFADGIYSWRGFLYFKWRQSSLETHLNEVIDGIANYRPNASLNRQAKNYIEVLRPQLIRQIRENAAALTQSLEIYETAYDRLIAGQDAGAFRQFLLDGPVRFLELGERAGILSHITSFWSYRMKRSQGGRLSVEDYMDVLMDLDDGLGSTYINIEDY
jgi:hypothetical protein